MLDSDPATHWVPVSKLCPADHLAVFGVPQTHPSPPNQHFLIAGELKYREAQEILEKFCFGLLSHPVQSW